MSLPQLIVPPFYLTLSCSSLLMVLWSHDKFIALEFLQRTALESPMFAQKTLFPIMSTQTQVAPCLFAITVFSW